MVGACGLARNLDRKRPPRWTAPVPEMVWRVAAYIRRPGLDYVCSKERKRAKGYISYPSFLDRGAVRADDKFLGSRRKLRKTGDGQIFMIEVRVASQDLVGLNRLPVSHRTLALLPQSVCYRTFFTTGSTQGFALLSLYAPIPRSTFFSKVSFR